MPQESERQHRHIGATRPEQVTENVAAVAQVEKLTADVMQRIEVILK